MADRRVAAHAGRLSIPVIADGDLTRPSAILHYRAALRVNLLRAEAARRRDVTVWTR
jgi:hypothetical protein